MGHTPPIKAEGSVILQIIPGTWRTRLANGLILFKIKRRLFSIIFLCCVCVGAVFGHSIGAPLRLPAYIAGALLLVAAMALGINTLGLDPGQRLVVGRITFTPTTIVQEDRKGRLRERGWKWILYAEEKKGDLHVVFRWHLSSIVLSKKRVSEKFYDGLRTLLAGQNKLKNKG